MAARAWSDRRSSASGHHAFNAASTSAIRTGRSVFVWGQSVAQRHAAASAASSARASGVTSAQGGALAAFSHASQFCPELGLFGAPFLFEDEAHFAAVFDGEVGAILDRACREHYSIRLLSTFTSGYRLLFNGRRPVETAADLQGLKIRVMGGEADALTWQAFGAIPVPMPYSEVYSALQAGVIDGAENEPASILSNRFYEAASHFAPTGHMVLPMGLFIGEATLQRLPEEHRRVLREQARATAVWQRDLMAERNAAALAVMRDSFGVRISSLDNEQLRRRALPIQDRVAEKLGLSDLLQRVRAAGRPAPSP